MRYAAWMIGASERLARAMVSIMLETYSHAISALREEATAKVAPVVFSA